MSEKNTEIKELVLALNGFVTQSKMQIEESKAQNKELSGEIKKIASNQEKLADQMTELVKINVQAQAWHEKHNEAKERFEQNQAEQGKKLDSYIKNNDERVITIEKQLILLDVDSKSNKNELDEKKKSRQSMRDKVFSSVITAAVLGGLAVIWGVVTA